MKRVAHGEEKLWMEYLRTFHFRVLPQRPIDNYIVDFYCTKLKLVIEIDGDHHCTEEGKTYDTVRDTILESYGLTVMRFNNEDIIDRLDAVCRLIDNYT